MVAVELEDEFGGAEVDDAEVVEGHVDGPVAAGVFEAADAGDEDAGGGAGGAGGADEVVEGGAFGGEELGGGGTGGEAGLEADEDAGDEELGCGESVAGGLEGGLDGVGGGSCCHACKVKASWLWKASEKCGMVGVWPSEE